MVWVSHFEEIFFTLLIVLKGGICLFVCECVYNTVILYLCA